MQKKNSMHKSKYHVQKKKSTKQHQNQIDPLIKRHKTVICIISVFQVTQSKGQMICQISIGSMTLAATQ